MISRIDGFVCDIFSDSIIILNDNNIGYEIFIKINDLNSLTINQFISLYIYQITKEDGITLYGFHTFEEKCWFEALIKLDGLGPKTAIGILSKFSIHEVSDAIINNDDKLFTTISGIGKKIASRIINEMQNVSSKIHIKVASHISSKNNRIVVKERDSNSNLNEISKNDTQQVNIKSHNATLIEDTVLSLVAMGFARDSVYSEIYKIIKNNPKLETPQEAIKFFFSEASNANNAE